jgi:sigma-E factor negative regulatory protein RseA
MRGEPCSDCTVMRSVSGRLTEEPTVLAPRRSSGDTKRRWALPSLAAAAAVATVTWMALETQQGGGAQPVAAGIMQPVVVPEFSGNGAQHLIRELTQTVNVSGQATTAAPIQFPAREFDAYLLAHQEFSPSNTLQGLAPYVRTVTSGALETRR